MADALKVTALHGSHVGLGARMVPFAGYDMPVQYQSVIAEAKSVRDAVGMFDVSHMARLQFRGPNLVEFLEKVSVNDVAKLEDGRGHYSFLPNPTGGVVDDIIIYRVTADEFHMVVNASNHEKDVAWLLASLPADITLTDTTAETSMIAVQGPKAAETLAALGAPAEFFRDAPLFGYAVASVAGIETVAARSGYTGEDGFELVVANEHAVALWDVLVAAGVKPCGLASRDTLRVEAGLPLYGHELTDDLNPIAAGLGWVIRKERPFIGWDAIQSARESGTPTKLQGIRLGTKRLLTPGMAVMLDGETIGEICSGVYSPVLDCGIGFAYLRSDVKLKTEVTVDIRGKGEPATVVSKRFLKNK